MTFVAIAVVFIGVCATIGLARPRASEGSLVAALAACAACAQLVLMLTR